MKAITKRSMSINSSFTLRFVCVSVRTSVDTIIKKLCGEFSSWSSHVNKIKLNCEAIMRPGDTARVF